MMRYIIIPRTIGNFGSIRLPAPKGQFPNHSRRRIAMFTVELFIGLVLGSVLGVLIKPILGIITRPNEDDVVRRICEIVARVRPDLEVELPSQKVDEKGYVHDWYFSKEDRLLGRIQFVPFESININCISASTEYAIVSSHKLLRDSRRLEMFLNRL